MDWLLLIAILVLVGLSVYYSLMASNMMHSFFSNPFGMVTSQLAPSTGQIIINALVGITGAVALAVVVIRGGRLLLKN